MLAALIGAYAFSLAFMQPAIVVFGFAATPSDLLFLLLACLWGMAVVTRRAAVAWDRAFAFTFAYLAALALSWLASRDPASTAAKLATQVYLVMLPIVVCSLVRDERALRGVVRAWLAGTVVVVAVGIASLLAFAIDPANPLFAFSRYHFGTLPPGPYPRLQLTFLNANMACNYLAMSLALLLGAAQAGWIGRGATWGLGGGIMVAAAATISPGLGGIVLLLAVWGWILWRYNRPGVARSILVAGMLIAFLFLVATPVTPILHTTAPFLISVPGTDVVLAPSGRLMVWLEAAANVLKHPLTGRGIGADAVSVAYRDPSGGLQQLSDAHNMFLSIAVQAGLIGLAALTALIWHVTRRTGLFRVPGTGVGAMRLAIGIGLLGALVYQGLSGSFEDARHLWFAIGLLVAASRIEARRRPS